MPGSVSSSLETQFRTANPAMQITNVSPPAIATLTPSSNDAHEIAVTNAVAINENRSIDLMLPEAFLAITTSSFD